ncbi:putative tumor necrosis factor receptor superfamily member 6 [Scophthalmus maximus]|uniref:Putative tumor necrosis factor receptor superfamily member 6 n=1 Tax=Scophthalmus maximus TaxID=52904 RepID=A0A2U9CCG4_SCOMX|nr:tumor necrosis factor receptor superfamily member 6 [Scophthalmus maximus]AWP13883.1 putative tumor necrosis factor receptor superfamily member 6 [Scophthalmus maximus]
MTASDSSRFTALLFAFVLFSSQVSLAYFSASFQTEGEVSLHPVKGLFRNRRQVCTDGTYKHEGRTCCLCAAGRRLESHCSAADDYGKCVLCDSGTYNSHPNALQRCEPCRSCEHPDANLEEEENCTPARNAKCRCQKDHFCISDTENCRICHACRICGTEGVRVDCTATNNTVCNERSEGLESGEKAAIIVSILVFAILIAAALYYMYVRRRKMRSRNLTPAQTNGNPAEVEFLPVKDLHLHLPDIAAILGWKDMKDVAMRSGISTTAIDSCKLDHPNNSEEQTLQLLVKWVEKQGMGASKDLIEILQKSDKHFKAEKVKEILQNDSTATSNNPV